MLSDCHATETDDNTARDKILIIVVSYQTAAAEIQP